MDLARMGIDAESFMATPLGKFLEGKARDEEAAALEELVNADPDDVKSNTQIRNQIHVARMFLVWMSESIRAGRAAYERLRELEDRQE